MIQNNNISLFTNKDLNIFSVYLKEISKYELLTNEEETQLGNFLLDINIIDPIFIQKDTKEYKYSLKYENILASLNIVEWINHEKIIDLLIEYLSSQDNEKDKSALKFIKKYKELTQKLGRALTDEELNKYFNLNINLKNKWGYSSTELERYIEIFIRYSKAYDTMYKSNLRLVVNVAKNYHTTTNILDLVAEGNIGLMRAIEKFDVRLGNKFSTYAVWWIKNSINNCIYDNKFYLRIPRNIYDEVISFNKRVNELENEHCRKLTILEISKMLNMSIDKVTTYLKYHQSFISVDNKVNDDNDTELIDFICDDYDMEGSVCNSQLKEDIKILFSVLSEKEIYVIKLRNGLTKSGKCYTLKEIADSLGITRERVRQIEFKSLKKMRRLSRYDKKVKELKEYIK